MQENSERHFKLATPIVINRRRKEKKPKAVKEAVRFERHLTKAAARIINASDAGFSAFRKSRRKSQNRDSARYALDIIQNMLDGTAVSLRRMSVVPVDLMKAFYTRRTSKLVRKSVKSASGIVTRTLSI